MSYLYRRDSDFGITIACVCGTAFEFWWVELARLYKAIGMFGASTLYNFLPGGKYGLQEYQHVLL